jgi:Pyruvate/2-oxoacid:ferredoxin oxidoreductase delta subunit
MSRLEMFVELFELPPAMLPHVDLVVSDREMDLVIGMGREALTLTEIAEKMAMDREEAEAMMDAARRRGIVAPAGETVEHEHEWGERGAGPVRYEACTFYQRVDRMAMYENWGDVPVEAREAVMEWQLQEFIDTWREAIEAMGQDPDARVGVPNRDYLLLEEALAMVEAAVDHVVVPCDCRSIVQACDRPLEVCVRLDEGARATLDAGHGRRVSKEEMKRLVVDANRAGLMQTGDRLWREADKLFGFCNCCGCDCYPIRAGRQLELDDAWPRVHHVAQRDLSACSHCGRCVRRCHFEAFYRDGRTIEVDGATRKLVAFDPETCRGCGICATGCPEGAIQMRAIREAAVEESRLD